MGNTDSPKVAETQPFVVTATNWFKGRCKGAQMRTRGICLAMAVKWSETRTNRRRAVRFSGAESGGVLLRLGPDCSVEPRLVRAARVDAVTRLFPHAAGATEMSSRAERIPKCPKGAAIR